MRLVDTHAHLDFPAFDPDRAEVIKSLAEQGIGVINIATDEDSVAKIDVLSRENDLIWGAVGLHPTEVGPTTLTELPKLIESWQTIIAANKKIVAIGEVGLDYFHDRDSAAALVQKAALRMMLTFAQEQKLPVIFHCREAYGDLAIILADYPSIKGVIHCFSGTQAQADSFLKLGFSLSATAIITYPKNTELAEVFKNVPSDRLMAETDSPFLPPFDFAQGKPNRGQRNDPRNVEKNVEFLAGLRAENPEEVAAQTTANAQKLFKLE